MSDRHDVSMKMQIINEALHLFKLYEYERVTVQDICDSCDLSRSAFYYHFRSKDEILDYCYLGADTLDIEAIYKNEAGLNALEQFYLIFEFYLSQTVSVGPELFSQILKRNIERHSLNFHPEKITQRETYIKLLEEAQAEGLIQNMTDPEILVDSIVYIANGIALIWSHVRGDLDIIGHHRRVINALLVPNTLSIVDSESIEDDERQLASDIYVSNTIIMPEERPSTD